MAQLIDHQAQHWTDTKHLPHRSRPGCCNIVTGAFTKHDYTPIHKGLPSIPIRHNRPGRRQDAREWRGEMSREMLGALAGWKRCASNQGIILTLQVARDTDHYKNGVFTRVHLALNDRQLRSLTRDLTRAATERGVDLWAPKPWWKLWARTRRAQN